MKTVLKYALLAVGAIILTVGGTALYLHLSGVPRYKVETIDLRVTVTPERVVGAPNRFSRSEIH